jgi:hypothetical protein
MTKGEEIGKGEKRSKYFSIDSYFKTPVVNKKIKLSSFEQQVDAAIELSLKKPEPEFTKLKKEQCPLCQTFIFIESVSMEVHVNACLDSQQKEEQKDKPSLKDRFACLKDTTSKENISTPSSSSKENSIPLVKDEKKEGGIRRILPTAWKSLFSASDTPVALPLDIKNVNTNTTMKSNKKKSCPFYKRMRGLFYI